MIEVVTLVDELRDLGTHNETMREASRNENLPPVAFGQNHSHPSSESLRTDTDVDDYIEDFTGHDPAQLRLGMRKLIVQTSQNAYPRERLVLLDEDCINPQNCELLPMIRLEEATARILEDLRLDYAHAGQRSIDSFQARSSRPMESMTARCFSSTLTIVD
jgi:hypothetical protein